jgi:hypothetical protein
MKRLSLSMILMTIMSFGIFAGLIHAQNIDPYNDGSKYAYGENAGWFNFRPTLGVGVTLRNGNVSGYAWQENIGWINLSPASYGGVTYDSGWNLSGYAWGENVGWIKFNPNYGGVTIDSAGNFSGWAWGENIGWIHFNSATPVAYKVRACVVSIDDIANLASQWLMNGILSADLNHSTHVDFADYSILASDWLDFCPDN